MTEILFLKPYFSHTIWGGSRLRKIFGYDEPGDDIGECWGISAHPDGLSYVSGGEYDGRSLKDLWENEKQLFGNPEGIDRFPLLVKLIDAKTDLSIQVHPDDDYARENENGSLGKSECWYVLDCPENGKLVVGHNAKTHEELQEMIENDRWNELIREVPIRKGDFISIAPGTVHAIKGGVLLLETQQNSDITYRVYDYGRLQNGKPRQLHIKQSLDVIEIPAKAPDIKNFSLGLEEPEASEGVEEKENPTSSFEVMCSNPKHSVYKAVVRGEKLEHQKLHPYMNATVINGSGKLCGYDVIMGDNLILTAGCEKLIFEGKMTVILSGVG